MVYGINGITVQKMGLSAADIMVQTTPIEGIIFKKINTKKYGIQDGHHGNATSLDSSVSVTAHNQIQELMRNSKNVEEFTI